MKIDLNHTVIDYYRGMLYITTDEINFMCEFTKEPESDCLTRQCMFGLQCQYHDGTPEYNKMKEQLIQIASGILNVIEMAGE